MRHIVHIIDNLNLGGGAQSFLASFLSNQSKRTGYRHSVIALYSPDPEYDYFLTCFKNATRLSSYRLNPFILPKLLMKIGKIKPDILHLHLEVSTSFAPMLKCVSGNSKIAASIYMTRAAAPRWAYPLFCGIKSAVDRYICGTDELTQMGVEESRVCRSLKIPIDIKSILPVESASNPVYDRHNLSRDSIILLSVGRLHPDKQHDLIIQCMPDLIRHNGKFRLVILGEGPERKKIERMISCIGADDYVVLAGFHHDVDNYYSAASIYLRASRNEGTNLSVLRAMAHKLPIIANFNNSPCECIRDRINGRQADFRYKSEVIQAISELISDPESASCYGETALQDVQEYDLEECMEGLQNIYEKITG